MNLRHAFITYITPIIKYNSSVRSPYYKSDIGTVRIEHPTFTCKLCGLCSLKAVSYEERLSFLSLLIKAQRAPYLC